MSTSQLSLLTSYMNIYKIYEYRYNVKINKLSDYNIKFKLLSLL